MLFGVLDAAHFPDNVYADLSGELHFLFDTLGNLPRHDLGTFVVHILRLDDDAHLATGLDRVALFNTLEGVGNLFQLA